MTAAGMSPEAILTAATSDAAAALGSLGHVKVAGPAFHPN
jgi:imidazolonepropionase-like amidohydrolase